jgi:hypothetical protein
MTRSKPIAVHPWSRRNLHFFAAGLGVIGLGYAALAVPPVNGFFSLTLAPLLLALGYAVLVPLGLVLPAAAPDST